LDENVIDPVQTFTVGYKKGDRRLSNFYTYDISQLFLIDVYKVDHFFSFVRADEYQFGNNTNQYCGRKLRPGGLIIDQGPFVTTNVTLKSIKVEISNFHVYGYRDDKQYVEIKLYAVIMGPGQYYAQELAKSVQVPDGAGFASDLKIDNKTIDLLDPSNLSPGQSLTFVISSNSIEFKINLLKDNTSIEITTNQESPLIQTKAVRLIEAANQVIKNYTASSLSVISNYIGLGGIFYNSSISTGVYLRGLPPIYTVGQKIKTSFKSLITDGVAKLLALGYDVLGNNVVIEDIGYFFKDEAIYDLSEKIYLREGFKINPDKDVTFNQLVFGSKKYSKNVKDDIRNFITSAEFTTPIVSIKNKFDKQTEIIIDEYKIQELIEDRSSSTNDNDDDLVLIDMVSKNDYWDYGVFDNCQHSIKNGKLVLSSFTTPFDTTMMVVGSQIEITEGYNAGAHTILEINGFEMVVSSSTTAIDTGNYDTPIRYLIPSLIKNRSIYDGFIDSDYIRDPETATNARHNPKYHMARWFPFFGSSLRKKPDSSLIKVTNYKNNSKAKMKINSPDLMNELPGLIEVGANETLDRLKKFKQPLFSGDIIEISFAYVSFEEFIQIYENWRYGINSDRLKSRGFITINTPEGLYDVYPFGNGAFSHDRKNNVLSIKGKIKGKSANNPVLLSVEQLDRNTVKMKWDFSTDYINPKIDIQFSTDGINWITLKQVINIKEDTFSAMPFNDVLTGKEVYFRIIAQTDELFNKRSNTISKIWQFNNYIITVGSKDEDSSCGYSSMYIDITGTANLNIKYNFISMPGGGRMFARNVAGDINDAVEIVTPYGVSYHEETVNKTISVNNETKRLWIQVFSTDKSLNGNYISCWPGNTTVQVMGLALITFEDQTNDILHGFDLRTVADKYY
ncbi:hypothetical protein, partial [Chryseobacterium sp.]|uniref:hypothetical protein n=1 Tax=Chryseobacterium sp. TaxID=1871047 RepID=UPI00321952D3